MLWTALAVGAGIVGLAMIFILLRGRRGRKRPGPARLVRTVVPVSPVEASASLYGLAPADAMRFRRAARAQMDREQAEWGRDYLSGAPASDATDPGTHIGAVPNRIAGIPRTLRVRR